MSDESEAIKAAAEGMVAGAIEPIRDLVHSLLGPAANEAGMILKDSVQFYRWKLRIRLFERTKEVLSDAGIDPTHVPLRLLMPIIENGSNEEDQSLQDIWANLLANAATPNPKNKVYPSFPGILKELTSADAKFLNAMFETAFSIANTHTHTTMRIEEVIFDPAMLRAIYRPGLSSAANDHRAKESLLAERQAHQRAMRLSLDTFERQGIIEKVYKAINRDRNDGPEIGIARSFTSFELVLLWRAAIPELGAKYRRLCL